MTEEASDIRLNFTIGPTVPVTFSTQRLYEKRGWRKWLALLLRKPVSEWRGITTGIEGDL